MGLDQALSSIFTVLTPAYLYNNLGDNITEEFIILQSYWIYIISIVSSLIINPYLYLEKIKVKTSSYLGSLSRINLVIIGLSSLIFLLTILIAGEKNILWAFFIGVYYKDSIRIINIQNGKVETNIIFQIALYIALIFLYFLFPKDSLALISSFFIINSIFAITFFIKHHKKNRKNNFSIVTDSLRLGQWSVYNMIAQLAIVQLIIYQLNTYQKENIIISYGVLVAISGAVNPIITLVNNFTVKTARKKSESMNLVNLKRWYLTYLNRYVILLLSIYPILFFSFPYLVTYLFDNEYVNLLYLFLFIYLGTIIGFINQSNSRILTIYGKRIVVFETGIASTIIVFILVCLELTNWAIFLGAAMVLNKLAACVWSSIRLTRLNE